MLALSPAFNRVIITHPGFSAFWMLVWAIAILDDAQRRKELRRKRERQARSEQPAPPSAPKLAPRPF